jgi:hypothetical protein
MRLKHAAHVPTLLGVEVRALRLYLLSTKWYKSDEMKRDEICRTSRKHDGYAQVVSENRKVKDYFLDLGIDSKIPVY